MDLLIERTNYMNVIFEQDTRSSSIKQVAQRMLLAARTAPKGRGVDNTVLAMVEGEDIKKICNKMMELSKRYDHPGFLRDAENILAAADILLLFGSKIKSMGLKKCGMCGFKDCAAKDTHPLIPCVFNTGDLGIAMGSAVSVAMDNRVDNRIMYSVGQAVLEMHLLGPEVRIALGVPLSATSKNPFFDRSPRK
jgi:uncharacterized ferredoxin-like protein